MPCFSLWAARSATGWDRAARLALCALIVCVATAWIGAAGGMVSLFLARLLLGIGEGAGFPTATRAMSAWTPRGRWGFAQGITHTFSRVGNAATSLIVAGLIARLLLACRLLCACRRHPGLGCCLAVVFPRRSAPAIPR